MKYLKKTLSIGYILYLIIDIFHFIFVRLNWKELEGVFFHLHYESIAVSISKWIFCIISLLLINNFIKVNEAKQHFIICVICGIVISITIFFGPFRGSIVGAVMLIDILCFLAVIYWFYKIDLNFKVRFFHYAIAILVYYLLPELTDQLGEYFYL